VHQRSRREARTGVALPRRGLHRRGAARQHPARGRCGRAAHAGGEAAGEVLLGSGFGDCVAFRRRRQGSTLGVPFRARGGLPRIATNSGRCRVSPLFSRARNLGAGCFVVPNPDDPKSYPPRFEYLIDPALPQPLPAQSGRDPVRRGQPLRPSYARDPGQAPHGRREGVPQRRGWGRDRHHQRRGAEGGRHETLKS
jgi:hypothetical protein